MTAAVDLSCNPYLPTATLWRLRGRVQFPPDYELVSLEHRGIPANLSAVRGRPCAEWCSGPGRR